MHLIKLDATDSTNAYLRRLLSSKIPEDYTVVWATRQTRGRGQMGTRWESETGKNLTFSLLRRNLHLDVQEGFILNICVSLAIYNVLERIKLPSLSIKWPNDILSGTSKICGILIENQIQSTRINTSIIGIGLNVNQITFDMLQNASSMHLLSGKVYDLDLLLLDVINELKNVFLERDEMGDIHLWKSYENTLFKRGTPTTFENSSGGKFVGTIHGVSKEGRLVIAMENDILKTFDLKEIRFQY